MTALPGLTHQTYAPGDFPSDALARLDQRKRQNPEFTRRAHAMDACDRGQETPVAARHRIADKRAVAAVARAEGAGLVSVPTSVPAPVQAAALRGELEAFEVDAAARRFVGLRMAVGFAARAHAVSQKGHRNDVPWMVTMTYAGDNDNWQGRHVSDAIKAWRRWCSKKGITPRYVWVAELQKRGVIHYHLVAWLPLGVRMPQWDRKGWWPHGMTNTEEARHATAYLMSYLKKGDIEARGALPRGARNYGVGGLDFSLRRARRWLRLPAFVRGNSSIWDNWNRAEGGGWVAPDGSRFVSEFTTARVAGVRCLVRVARHPITIEANGPFSWLSDRERGLMVH